MSRAHQTPYGPLAARMNMRHHFLLTVLISLAPALAAQSTPFTAEDMLDIVQISGGIAVSPDADRLAYVLPDLSLDENVMERAQIGYVHIQELDSNPVQEIPGISIAKGYKERFRF